MGTDPNRFGRADNFVQLNRSYDIIFTTASGRWEVVNLVAPVCQQK